MDYSNIPIFRVTYWFLTKSIVEGYISDVAFEAHLKELNSKRDQDAPLHREDFDFELIIIRF